MQGDFKRTDGGPSSPRLKAGASGPKYLVRSKFQGDNTHADFL